MLCVIGGEENLPPLISTREMGIHPVCELYLGMLDGVHCYATEIGESTELPEGMGISWFAERHGDG